MAVVCNNCRLLLLSWSVLYPLLTYCLLMLQVVMFEGDAPMEAVFLSALGLRPDIEVTAAGTLQLGAWCYGNNYGCATGLKCEYWAATWKTVTGAGGTCSYGPTATTACCIYGTAATPVAPVPAPAPSPTTKPVAAAPAPSPITPASSIMVMDKCKVPGTVALTFDDGMTANTAVIANKINNAGGKATFFVVGQSQHCIYNAASTLKSIYNQGHQIGSHTWSHASLVNSNDATITTEMTRLRDAFRRIIGASPTYMRPPYGAYDARVNNKLQQLGIRYVITWSLVGGDAWGWSLQQQKASFDSAPTGVSHIALAHDTYPTVLDLTDYMIQWAKQRGLRMVTVGECMGDSKANWYSDYTTPGSYNPSTWKC